MSKEIIYVEADDDITTIINKVKDSPEKIVALVPPKQIGVLQSAVNLELLARNSKNSQKVLVIVTNNQALMRLAGLTKIPIAKSFKSKPELIEVPTLKIDGEDDIIDGTELSIGEFAGVEQTEASKSLAKSEAKANQPKEDLKPAKIKVPNYNKFRKRLLIGLAFLILLVGFLVWALIFAPRAEITIRTKTKTKAVSETIKLVNDSKAQDVAKKQILTQSQTLSKKKTIEFLATGEKNIGQPASGTLTLTNQTLLPRQVAVGTGFSRGDCTFTTTQAVTIPGPTGTIDNLTPGRIDVNVKATVAGPQCNLEAGNYASTINQVVAVGSAMTGGTEKIVKVITKDDLDKASLKLDKLTDEDYVKELRNKFDSSVVIIDDSLKIKSGKIITPAVDQVAKDGKAKLEQSVDYTLYGIAKKDIYQLVDFVAIKDQANIKVYQSDEQKIDFVDYVVVKDQASVRILTQAVVGPKLDKQQIKQFAAGKIVGQIKDHYEPIEGVSQVNVEFYPLWVRTVPKDANKIKVEIELIN